MKSKLLAIAVIVGFVAITTLLNRQINPTVEHDHEAPPVEQRKAPKPGRIVNITTNRGQIRFVLYEKDMPVTCKNFVELVERGFYNGLTFHRVESVVVQGGDPKGDGTGDSEKKIKLEARPDIGFDVPYVVGMARSDDPDSASCQFFINKEPWPSWNGNYAAFGRVFDGQDVVDKIQVGDVMKKVTLSKPTRADLALIAKVEKPSSTTSSDSHVHDDNCQH